MQKRFSPLASIVLAGLAALVLVAGCAHDQSTSPVTQPAARLDGQPSLLTDRDLGRSGPDKGSNDNTTTVSIDPRGGSIQIDDVCYLIKVTFPKGAVAQTVDVNLALVDNEHVQFVVTPANLVLLKPVTVLVQKLDKTTRVGLAPVRLFHKDASGWNSIGLMAGAKDVSGSSDQLGEFGALTTTWLGQPIELLRWLSGPSYTTVLIPAWCGGTVTNGRYSVTFPSWALRADTWITVRDPGSPYLLCLLEPEGTVFNVPVKLSMDCHGLNTAPFNDWTIWYFNESTSRWEDQGGTFDGTRIRADLRHFSVYAAGRAGW